MTAKYKGFETMAASAKYTLLLSTYGYCNTLLVTWRGLTLGLTTRMPLTSHLPSVETIALGIPIGSALLNRICVYGDYLGKPLENRIVNWLSPPLLPPLREDMP
jgi:hypothetical protein